MTTFPYTEDIPDPPHNPSSDVPNMKTNTNSISGILEVDHVGFNAANGGQHLQVTFEGNNIPASQPAALQSVLYTNVGVADASHPQLFWGNFNSWQNPGPTLTTPFHLSGVRAWAYVPAGSTGPSAPTQSSNISTISRSGAGLYTITLKSGSVSSTNYGVLLSSGLSGSLQTSINYSVVSQYVINIFIRKSDSTSTNLDADWTIQVLQI